MVTPEDIGWLVRSEALGQATPADGTFAISPANYSPLIVLIEQEVIPIEQNILVNTRH